MMSSLIPLFFFLIQICLCMEGCIESERAALLQFKNGLTDPSNRLSGWDRNASDCCTWTGVVCSNKTGHVLELHLRTLSREEYFGPDESIIISDNEASKYEEYRRKSALGGKVSSSLLQLKYLSYLDLSFNDFGGVRIPEFIGSMQSLRYFNLCQAGFGGFIPPQIGNLSNLKYLNLQYNDLGVKNLDWVTTLSSLEFLDLSGVDLSQSFDWLEVMNTLPSLVELHLSFCILPGFSPSSLPNLNFSSLTILDLSENYFGGRALMPIPNVLQNMSSFLRELDLSLNQFNSSIPNWLYERTHLQGLNLRNNHLQGQVSSRIGNLTSLISLDLSHNDALEFEKGIPKSFENFCNLRSLSLSGVKLSQQINDVFAIMSMCVSSGLQELELYECQLSGHLTDDIAHFKNLVFFDISNNLISGLIPLSLGNLTKLEYVDISNNDLEGEVSQLCFENLTKLEYVDISNNDLEGEVSQLCFENLTRLSFFLASRMRGNIALRVSSNWIPPLQLQVLELGSWKIGPQFPEWLRLLKHLWILDLSNYGISARVPIWFWDLLPSYQRLNFSHNQMQGSIPNIPYSNGLYQFMFDLSYNNFSGGVPYFSSNLSYLDLSHNSFSGSLFNLLCYKMNEVKQMYNLNLEGNFLYGDIPDCWGSWKYLFVVILSNNTLSGKIPNSIGTLSYLESLHLDNNNLSGEVPSSIQNCTRLLSLDISENNLVGKTSTWIGDRFSDLIILNLRANKFDGFLPKELCHLVSLQVLDLSCNKFFGTIPSCFGNFSAMATIRGSNDLIVFNNGSIAPGRRESVVLFMKGEAREYSSNLGLVRSIDLSNNNITGEIPKEITSLKGLLSLNLSRNGLTGIIPKSIGDMKGLDAIDFSHNQLYGEVPESMSTLTYLGTLDLSYNNLSGRIPSGTQLQGFNSSSFMGNHLCGLPLTNNCTLNNALPVPHAEEDDDDGDEVDVWFYQSMVYGFVFGFWSAVGSLIFIRKWRHFCFHYLGHLREIIWWNLIGRFH